LLLQAAARRTPTVLDGLGPAAAALVAHGVAPSAADWWLTAQRYPEPAYDKAVALLAIQPLLDLGLRHGDGLGAVLTVPLIRAAAALLAE
jgi:nicotinate-nucleotide--dimethylbenzimidazole phosphoribosyltransferase